MTTTSAGVPPPETVREAPGARQVATFALGDLAFGVDVRQVQEVIRARPITPVPCAPVVVRGLINLRGEIVAAIDMRRRLDLPDRAGGEPPMHVVVRTPDGAVSLLVDGIGDVLHLDPAQYEPAPPTLTGPVRELVSGVYKLDGRLLPVLDVTRVIADDGSAERTPK